MQSMQAETAKKFNGVEVFSATMARDRDQLGHQVTEWIRKRGDAIEVLDVVVTQSSDHAFHCVSITVFFREDLNAPTGPR